jgi:hypothetical protein
MLAEYMHAEHADWWECTCGNTPNQSGFYPCNNKGAICEPDHSWDGIHYICYDCGTIVNQYTLMLVGHADYHTAMHNADYWN